MNPLLSRLSIVAILSGSLLAQEPSALDKAEVRIPYLELKKLWEASQSANAAANKPVTPEPSPAGALLSSIFHADLSSGQVAMEAEFKAESFGDHWEKLPLMGAGFAVASVEPADARLIIENDQLCLLMKQSGVSTVKVRFVETPILSKGEIPFLLFTSVPSAVASLEIIGLPKDRLAKYRDGSVLPVRDGATSLGLPAKGGEIALVLADVKMLPKEEPPPAPPEPSEWSLQNEVLVFQDEAALSYRIRAHAIALNGSALEGTMILPPNARDAKLEGADLADWKMQRKPDGTSELRLRWNTRDVMERDLKISYSVQQLPLAPDWELKAPAVMDAERTKTLFMVQLPPGIEFSGKNLQGPVPVAKLSRWVAEESKGLEFGTVAGSTNASLQSRLLPRLETAVAVVTKSDYTTKLVSDGSALTEATLEIQHDDALRWAFTLPEKSELLKCFINDVAIKPIAREKGVMEIPLDHSAGQKSKTSRISFSFTAAKGRLEPVEGDFALELPLTPLFIHEINWSIEIPGSYEASFSEAASNMELSIGSEHGQANTLRITKKLCRNERPQAQLFYKKRGIE